MVSQPSAMFGGHRYCGSGDIRFVDEGQGSTGFA